MRHPPAAAEVLLGHRPLAGEDRRDGRGWVGVAEADHRAKDREPLRMPVVEAVALAPANPLAAQRRFWDQ
jgi:hypothetical protein